MNEIKKHMNEFLSLDFKPFFKKNGYKKSGVNFIKKEDNSYKICTFQNNSFQFTIHMGVYFPEINKYEIEKDERDPKYAYDCHLQQRIGLLSQYKRDTWWSLYWKGSQVDLKTLSKEVYDIFVNCGFSWLDNCGSYSSALEYIKIKNAIDNNFFTLPSLYLILGNKQSAIESLVNTYNKQKKHHAVDLNKQYYDNYIHIVKMFNIYSDNNNLGVHFSDVLE